MAKATLRTAIFALVLAVATAPLAHEALAQTAQPAASASATQVPQPQEGGVNWPGVGYGAGALFGNVLYIPAKLVYAVGGGLVGGLAYLVTAGNIQTSDTIWRSSLGGDYVLTPDMIEGNQPINFSGPTGTPPENAAQPLPAGANTTASAGGSGGTVAPIAPIPAAGGAQPLDSGSGPASSSGGGAKLPGTSIE